MADTVNIEAFNTETFVWAQDVTDFAALYPLAAGIFRAQMRASAAEQAILYEWSTTNGGIAYTEAPASGSIAFTANPIAASVIKIGATTVTFVASGASGNQVNIGGSLATTLASLLSMLNASTDAQLITCSYTIIGSDALDVVARHGGISGDNIALSTNVVGATATGATLTGGAHIVTLMAPVSAIENFSGAYSYDCRFEYQDAAFTVLFDGSITLDQGVTRESTDSQVLIESIPSAAAIALTPTLLNALIFG